MMITGTKEIDYNAATIIVDLKKEFYVSEVNGMINVLMKNAAHAAYRGLGRFFNSWEEAEESYKSPAAKSAIKYAREILN